MGKGPISGKNRGKKTKRRARMGRHSKKRGVYSKNLKGGQVQGGF